MNRILLVEDDPSIIRSLSEFLSEEGFSVRQTDTQSEAVRLASGESFDLVLMDIALSQGNGFAACACIKAVSDVPVIFLTASGDEGSTVVGFDLGADDYIAKPFRPRELISRMKNAIRRHGGTRNNLVQLENVSVDTDKGIITKNGQEITLSALEYKILLVFIANRGRILSRSRLLEEIWDIAGDYVNDNTLTVYIKRIREKIEDNPSNPKIIKTVRGMGYRVD
jgi:DNA-binding response OmpR family regulator